MEALLCQGFSALKFCPFGVYEKKIWTNYSHLCRFLSIYRSSGRILSVQVTTWSSHRFHQCVVCLITSPEPCCPTKKQQIYKFNWKKVSFNCSAIATKCPNSQLRCPLRTHWQHALPFFSDNWLQWTISPSPPRKSLFNFYICMKYTLCVPHLYVNIKKKVKIEKKHRR